METMTQRLPVLAFGLLLWTACSKEEPEVQRNAALRPTPATTTKPRAQASTRTAVPEPTEPTPIDPSLVPVEEDFRTDAESKITKRSNLEAELDRISRELSAASE